MARMARSKGGDLLDLDDSVDRLIIELDYSYWFQRDGPRADAAMYKALGGIRQRIVDFTRDGTLDSRAHLPLFANDAGYKQDYFARLRPDRKELARRVGEDVDPTGFWKTRTGGFKF